MCGMNLKEVMKVLSFLFFFVVLGVLFFALFTQKSSAPPQQRSEQIEQKTLKVTSENLPLQILSGYTVGIFAENLNQPRDLQFSPDGMLLVSTPGDSTVLAFPDRNNDGKADDRITILSDLKTPHGLAFYKNKLYVATVDKVNRYAWDEKQLKATFEKTVVSLPGNSNHIYRTILFKNDQLYISVGSTCNVCNEKNSWNGTIIVSSPNRDDPHVFAKGQRNAPFMTLNPNTQEIWATGMGRGTIWETIFHLTKLTLFGKISIMDGLCAMGIRFPIQILMHQQRQMVPVPIQQHQYMKSLLIQRLLV